MKAIVLAAGKGKRLLSEQHNMPKVLRVANGKPLLRYVVDNLSFIPKKEDIIIVAGYKKELVFQSFDEGYTFVSQDEQLGTGHAVNMAREAVADYDGPLLVCYGDMPMFRQSTYQKLIEQHLQQGNDCTVLTGVTQRKLAYGRVVRTEEDRFDRVVEEKDCNEQQKLIRELNLGIYVFDCQKLFEVLHLLKNNNAQGEYYLTDAPKLMKDNGDKIGICTIYDDNEILGVNTPEELALCEQLLKQQ